jgi:hypothetical protein
LDLKPLFKDPDGEAAVDITAVIEPNYELGAPQLWPQVKKEIKD